MLANPGRAQQTQPLQWHWLYVPLVAYLVFSVGPSILAPILFVLSFFVDIPVRQLADPISLIVSAFFLGLTLWPFLWLYGFARDALIADPSAEKVASTRDDHVERRDERTMFAALAHGHRLNDVVGSRCLPGDGHCHRFLLHIVAASWNLGMAHWPRDCVDFVALTDRPPLNGAPVPPRVHFYISRFSGRTCRSRCSAVRGLKCPRHPYSWWKMRP